MNLPMHTDVSSIKSMLECEMFLWRNISREAVTDLRKTAADLLDCAKLLANHALHLRDCEQQNICSQHRFAWRELITAVKDLKKTSASLFEYASELEKRGTANQEI